ncbi:glycoside hydrolase family 15 protein [Marinibacterium sp. SX1]|uniref:glycoside hydrolase family 15 protein n=1 Tax=Marinibacterium sp. SX1 TaxID=3388424 RepID=UPI003D17618B
MTAPAPWIAARRLAAARAMRAATSATELLRDRPGFGWRVAPARGSILASPRMASWDPEPDYFHHWVRDAAIVLAAVPQAMQADPEAAPFWRQAVIDHVAFGLHISDPDRQGPAGNPLRPTTLPSHMEYLRPDAELAALSGSAWLDEPRVAADGGPDLERWSRPQDDGPALRAAGLMRLGRVLPEAATPAARRLIARDLAHVLRVAGRPAIGPWEEEPPRRTSFTLIAQWDALDLAAGDDPAGPWQAAADRLAALIADTMHPGQGYLGESIEDRGRLDSATLLAILHAGRHDGPLALDAPSTLATARALERVFGALYPINRGRAEPAIGRWDTDVYFGGNPWFPNTLGMAELHYRLAALDRDRAAFDRAEGWMALVHEVAPDPDQPLAEQFDRSTGAPTSCLMLTWSAAAFLEATGARETAVQALAGSR